MNYDIEYVEQIVNNALDKLYYNEEVLFATNTSERNLVFHFARYFCDEIKETIYSEYDVDCEYNRNAESDRNVKEVLIGGNTKKSIIYPDFILHKRRSNEFNILAIEFKKYSNSRKMACDKDKEKLKALTNINASFRYKVGLFIVFGKERKSVKITRIINGEIIGE